MVHFPGLKSRKSKSKERTEGWSSRLRKRLDSHKVVQWVTAQRWMLLLSAMGVLLGRATILDELSPFALAYFAVITFLRRDLMLPVAVSVVLGSLLAPYPSLFMIGGELLVFYFLYRGLRTFDRLELSYAPLMVFLSVFMVNLFNAVMAPTFTWYELIIVGTDAVLSFMLTLVFTQAIPLFTYRKKTSQLKNEEILCLIILLASVMTGAVGWTVHSLSVDHVLSRYLVLVFALVGGASLGASVGVITGLILSLANMSAIVQMSLLAFAGLLAGMLREGKKGAVALGMLLGSSILTIYLDGTGDVLTSTWESCAAILLFLMTPKSFFKAVSTYVPGTQDHAKSQHEYAKRVRDLTAERVTKFSRVFSQLSRSFHQISASESTKSDGEIEHFMNAVAEGTCASCFKCEQCWDGKFMQTHQYMTEMMSAIEDNPDLEPEQIPRNGARHVLKRALSCK